MPDWPAHFPENRAVSALVPYARNARTHSAAQVGQVAASIREWGWTTPVLVDEAGTIIAGHARVLAAQSLNLAEIPVIVARGWSEAQKRAYVIADNQLALNAGWDENLLKIELSDLKGLDFDLDLLGFDPAALNGLLDPAEGLTDPDEVPETPAEPVSRLGDLWFLGHHRLLCGDATNATDVSRALGGVNPHLMVTDPPYGVSYDPKWRSSLDPIDRATGEVPNDERLDWREAWALFPGDVAYIGHADQHASAVQASLESTDLEIRAQIIWAKPHFVISRGHYHSQHEPCWYAVRKAKTGHWSGDRTQSTIWQIDNKTFQGGKHGPEDDSTGHGTQKPVECMRRPIMNNSSPGQAVYDPFVGSGTTIIAAETTARACHAIELNPAYVDVALLRWQAFTGDTARDEAGFSFADIAARRTKEAA